MSVEAFVHPLAGWSAGLESELVRVGGLFNAVFAAFHLTFWKLFSWRYELRTLTFVNRGVVQVLNLCLIAVFGIFAYLSLAHTEALITQPVGHSLISLISLFWLARAVAQVVFFRLRHWGSWLFVLVFLSGALLYGLPASVILWPPESIT